MDDLLFSDQKMKKGRILKFTLLTMMIIVIMKLEMEYFFPKKRINFNDGFLGG